MNKVYEGRPDITDMMKDEAIHLVMNTTEGAHAATLAIKAQAEDDIRVKPLQG